MKIRTVLARCMALYERTVPVLVRRAVWRRLQADREALAVLYAASMAERPEPGTAGTHGIVFSRDRAMQLHALLSSYARHVVSPRPVLTVIYRATSERHHAAYQQVFGEIRRQGVEVRVVAEEAGQFRAHVLAALEQVEACQVFFLVDDMLFVRPVDFGVIRRLDARRHIFSLRLGRHITFSYSIRQKLALPPFVPAPLENALSWCWRDGAGEWDYPLSVDGHVFDRREIASMLADVSFRAPNSLETNLVGRFHPWVRLRAGVCFPEASVVNVPLNRVQSEADNRAEGGDPDELLRHWEAGEMLDFSDLTRQLPSSVHVPAEERFVPRSR